MSEDRFPLITRQRLITAACVLVAVGLPVIMLMPPETAADDPTPAIPPAPLKIATMEAAAAALEAPMFNAERRQPVISAEGEAITGSETAPAVASAPTPVGLITGRRLQAMALLRSADGQTAIARVGDVIDGWKVTMVSAAGVTFEKGAERQEVGLDYRNRTESGGSSPPAISPPSASSHAGQ